MQNRRNFIKRSGVFALGSAALFSSAGAAFFEKKKLHAVGLQLYTVTNVLVKDVAGTLKQIAAIGYKELESAESPKGNYYGLNPKVFAAMAKDAGLIWLSNHVNGAPYKRPGVKTAAVDTTKRKQPKFDFLKNLQEDYQELIDEAAEGGLKFLVCASIPLVTADEIKEAASILNTAGEAAKKAGITLCYHNHTHEFEAVEGIIPYDYLLAQTNADILKFELDLAWVTKAGADPVQLFYKNPGRFPLWHVKDLSADKKQPVEVGTGIVNFRPIFAAAKKAGMKHFFVEQDDSPKPMENITTSYNNIVGKILA